MATEAHEAIWSMGDDTPIAALAHAPRRVTGVPAPGLRPGHQSGPSTRARARRHVAPRGRSAGSRRSSTRTGSDVVVLDGRRSSMPTGGDGCSAAFDRVAPSCWTRPGRPVARAARARACPRPARATRPGRRATGRRSSSWCRTGPPGRGRVAGSQRPRRGPRPPGADGPSGSRSRTDLVVEAGDAFDVHDVAMLSPRRIGRASMAAPRARGRAGGDAGRRGRSKPDEARRERAGRRWRPGCARCWRGWASRSVASYRGGQLFDVIGLDPDLGATDASRPPASGRRTGTAERSPPTPVARHRRAFARGGCPSLEDPGLVRFRGDRRAARLRAAGREGHSGTGRRPMLAGAAGGVPRRWSTTAASTSRAPALRCGRHRRRCRSRRSRRHRSIARRFVSSAMSLGALSPEAHQAISIGMARLGGSANSGEGGEDPAWYAADDGRTGATPPSSRWHRRASASPPSTSRAPSSSRSRSRRDRSPARAASCRDEGDRVHRRAAPRAAGHDDDQPSAAPRHLLDRGPRPAHRRPARGQPRGADRRQAGGGPRGSAPSPPASPRRTPTTCWCPATPAGQARRRCRRSSTRGCRGSSAWRRCTRCFCRNRLRDRVALRTDGGLQTGRDVVIAATLGAEEFGFGTAALVAMGCDMARQCHLDTCPTGIATQREDLRAKFTGTPEQVVAFFTAIAEDVRRELAALGLRQPGRGVGRADLSYAAQRWPGRRPPRRRLPPGRRCRARRPAQGPRPLWASRLPDASFEAEAWRTSSARADAGEAVGCAARVTPRDRSVGARLAGALARRPEPAACRACATNCAGRPASGSAPSRCRGCASQSSARPTTTSPRASRAAWWSCAPERPADRRPGEPGDRRQRVPLRRHGRRPPRGRPRRDAVRRPQHGGAGGGRGHRRPRLRVHDRRRGGGAGRHRAELRRRDDRGACLRAGHGPAPRPG